MAVKEVLLLGNPQLYQPSEPVSPDEVESLKPAIEDLHDTLMAFREKWGAGRAVAAPQIGVMKRLIYMNIDNTPTVFINPSLSNQSEETIEVWDDCMSFPEILVKVKRHARCTINYCDLSWEECSLDLEGSLSELLQHEYDHLDGVMAVSLAIDGQSFALRSQKEKIKSGRTS